MKGQKMENTAVYSVEEHFYKINRQLRNYGLEFLIVHNKLNRTYMMKMIDVLRDVNNGNTKKHYLQTKKTCLNKEYFVIIAKNTAAACLYNFADNVNNVPITNILSEPIQK